MTTNTFEEVLNYYISIPRLAVTLEERQFCASLLNQTTYFVLGNGKPFAVLLWVGEFYLTPLKQMKEETGDFEFRSSSIDAVAKCLNKTLMKFPYLVDKLTSCGSMKMAQNEWTPPDRIFLVDPCGSEFTDGTCRECGSKTGFCLPGVRSDNGVEWCGTRQNDTDIEYVLAGSTAADAAISERQFREGWMACARRLERYNVEDWLPMDFMLSWPTNDTGAPLPWGVVVDPDFRGDDE